MLSTTKNIFCLRFEWFSEMEIIERVSSSSNTSKSSKHVFTYQEHKTKGLSTYVTMKKSMSLLMVKNVNNRYVHVSLDYHIAHRLTS